MASINFPNNPAYLDLFIDPLTDNTYLWNGEAWVGYAFGGINRDSFWGKDVVGIHTLDYVGIGTELPRYQLHVVGETFFDGLVSVGILSGDARTLTNLPVGLSSRTVVSQKINNINNLDTKLYQFDGFKSYALMKIETSSSAWVRIYTDSASRSYDISNRSLNEDPTPGTGIVAEVVTREYPFRQIFSPYSMGGNFDNPPTTTIYAAATNLCGISTDLTVSLTILKLEA